MGDGHSEGPGMGGSVLLASPRAVSICLHPWVVPEVNSGVSAFSQCGRNSPWAGREWIRKF